MITNADIDKHVSGYTKDGKPILRLTKATPEVVAKQKEIMKNYNDKKTIKKDI